jgi:hypothetical protein
MELICDWKNFQHLFFTKKRQTPPSDAPSVVFLILKGKVIVHGYAENEDLNSWIGATVDEILLAMPEREIVQLEKEKVDQWVGQAGELGHFYEQMLFFRTMAKPYTAKLKRSKFDETWVHGHFLLEAVQTWWCKMFPAQYGIYIQLDGFEGPSLLMIIKRGKIDSFHVPDLSSLAAERKKQNQAIIKYLSGRYVVPIQGFFITSEEWMAWMDVKNPWSKILAAIQQDRSKLAPLNWGLLKLIASRVYLRI